jgi:hypothetical protein
VNPCKLTPETAEKILERIRAGAYRETACAAAGIGSRTLRDWLRKAAHSKSCGVETKFTEFADRMDEAEAEAEHTELDFIRRAGSDDWRAAAWILERRGAKRWGIKKSIELSGGLDVSATPEAAARLVREAFGSVGPEDVGHEAGTEDVPEGATDE